MTDRCKSPEGKNISLLNCCDWVLMTRIAQWLLRWAGLWYRISYKTPAILSQSLSQLDPRGIAAISSYKPQISHNYSYPHKIRTTERNTILWMCIPDHCSSHFILWAPLQDLIRINLKRLMKNKKVKKKKRKRERY